MIDGAAVPTGGTASHHSNFTCLHFRCVSWFATITLAHFKDSLARVPTSRLKSVGRKLRQHLYSTAYGSPLQPGLQQLQQRGKALLSPTLPAQSGSSAKPPPPERGGDAVKQSLCYPSVCGSWLMPPQGYNTTPAPQGVPGNKPPAPVAAPRTQTDVGVAKA